MEAVVLFEYFQLMRDAGGTVCGFMFQVVVQEEEGGRCDEEHSFSASALVPSATGRCSLALRLTV